MSREVEDQYITLLLPTRRCTSPQVRVIGINAASTANFTVKDYTHTEKTQSTEELLTFRFHPTEYLLNPHFHYGTRVSLNMTTEKNKAVYTVSMVLNNRLSEDLR